MAHACAIHAVCDFRKIPEVEIVKILKYLADKVGHHAHCLASPHQTSCSCIMLSCCVAGAMLYQAGTVLCGFTAVAT